MMASRFFLAPLILALLFAGTKSTHAQAEKESAVEMKKLCGKRWLISAAGASWDHTGGLWAH